MFIDELSMVSCLDLYRISECLSMCTVSQDKIVYLVSQSEWTHSSSRQPTHTLLHPTPLNPDLEKPQNQSILLFLGIVTQDSNYFTRLILITHLYTQPMTAGVMINSEIWVINQGKSHTDKFQTLTNLETLQ